MRKGKYVTNEVQAAEKVYQDLRLEVPQQRRPQLDAGEGQRESTGSPRACRVWPRSSFRRS
jgi:hypothetical protein